MLLVFIVCYDVRVLAFQVAPGLFAVTPNILVLFSFCITTWIVWNHEWPCRAPRILVEHWAVPNEDLHVLHMISVVGSKGYRLNRYKPLTFNCSSCVLLYVHDNQHGVLEDRLLEIQCQDR